MSELDLGKKTQLNNGLASEIPHPHYTDTYTPIAYPYTPVACFLQGYSQLYLFQLQPTTHITHSYQKSIFICIPTLVIDSHIHTLLSQSRD